MGNNCHFTFTAIWNLTPSFYGLLYRHFRCRTNIYLKTSHLSWIILSTWRVGTLTGQPTVCPCLKCSISTSSRLVWESLVILQLNEGLVYTDYAIAPLQQHRLFSIFSRQCKWYYHLNIRGIQCSECTAVTNQREGRSWFINSYASKYEAGCNFDGRPGMRNQERNFGWYEDGKINSKDRCSSSLSSTTEHWFGISNS